MIGRMYAFSWRFEDGVNRVKKQLRITSVVGWKRTAPAQNKSTQEELEFREEIAMHARKEDQIKDEKPNNSLNSLIWFGICLLLLFVNVAEFLFH